MASQTFIQRALSSNIVKISGKRTTYLLSIDSLREIGAKRWSLQRPADENRVTEICQWIEKEKDVSGIISMAWHPKETLIVYDGQHRWCALLKIQDTPIQAIVEIIWDATEEEIIASFQSINRSVSVPELYTDPLVIIDNVRPEIIDFVTTLSTTYREFLSTTDKPNRPHFNRDKLSDELLTIWRDEFHKEIPFSRIVRGLVTMNEEYNTNELSVPREASRKYRRIYEKCNKHRFWLFAQTGRINTEHLSTTIQKYV